MTLEPLQQWLPAAVLVVLHRVTHPELVAPIARRMVGWLKRSEPVIEEVAHIAAATSAPAAPISQPEPAQQEKPRMQQFDISTLANAMSKAAAAVQNTHTLAQRLYSFGAQMIATAEKAYAANGAGAHKKAAVIAAVQSLAGAFETDYATIAPEFEAWLETVIGAYNAAAPLLNAPTAPANTVQKVEAAIKQGEQFIEGARQVFGLTGAQVARDFGAVGVAPVSAANTQGV